MKKILLFILVSYSMSSMACSFDTDCNVGSKCMKEGYNIYGVCVGGLSPGNSNDTEPVYDSMDMNGTYGNTCSFDTDCGVGGRCIKESGYITGTCLN